jgi:phosphoglycerate dehydrogenase-like enzyme
MSGRLTVLSQFGGGILAEIVAAAPEVDVVEVPVDGEVDPAVEGEVLLAMHRSAALPEIASRGVRWVHNFGTGVDGFPHEVYEGRVVTCSRGAGAVPISEFVLATMLAFEKDVPAVWRHDPPEHWGWAKLGGMQGRTLGLVGLGGIGAAIAERTLAFDMRVIATRRTSAPSPLAGVEVVDLATVLAEADHLVVAAPATVDTRHLLDAGAFAAVKPGVHLVNIARGTLVDQDALRDALDDGRVARASLDVCDPEPLPEGHWLYEHPKVRLSAHVSWSSPGLYHRILELFLDNLRRYLAGEPLEGVVDPVAGY